MVKKTASKTGKAFRKHGQDVHATGIVSLLLVLAAVMGLASCVRHAQTADAIEPFTFVQICDPQLGYAGYEHDVSAFVQAVNQINTLNPDFVVICGDLVNRADDSSFADFKKIKSGLRMPSYCAAGNHDVGNEPTAESLQYYRDVIGNDYFSFEHKGAVFIVVNTQLWKKPLEGESEKHDVWLRETLRTASEKGGPVFIVGHCPLFTAEPDEPDVYENLPLEKRRELLDLFEQYHVLAVVGGHTHRLILNDYKGIQLINAEAISKNSDKHALGFRVWQVQTNHLATHRFVGLEGF